MKKTQRASGSSAKPTKKSAHKKPAVRRADGRFPVRGAQARPAGKSGAGGKVGRGGGKTGKKLGKKLGPGGGVSPRPPELEAAPRGDVSETRALAVAAMDAAMDKKALSPVLIDVSGMASYTDFIGIVSGRSDRQVDAIADGITQAMKARGRRVLGQEGTGSGRWTLLDFGAFVVHVFYHPVREFYDLESLWIDAPRVKLVVPPEASLSQPDALYGAL